ncbi:MAG: hypothetical protein GX590_02465, partial [Lentisphaerae bacterium]|nr:hypothetical protein [Lentisphaerota bacterium]
MTLIGEPHGTALDIAPTTIQREAMMKTKGAGASLLMLLLASTVPLRGAESATWQASYHFPSGSLGPLAVHKGFAYVMNAWTRGDGLMVFDARRPE